jgi:hypothetical protein
MTNSKVFYGALKCAPFLLDILHKKVEQFGN